ncbi:MAG: hypothetical protein KIS63_02550 [Caldilineales bacterium]|nr:hypothetical protein [Caldilineales bacterium]
MRHPDRLVVTLDHAVPAPTTQHAANHAEVRRFVAEQGVRNFFEAGRGVCHQVLSEEAIVWPGQVILGADSHTTHFGWMVAFGQVGAARWRRSGPRAELVATRRRRPGRVGGRATSRGHGQGFGAVAAAGDRRRRRHLPIDRVQRAGHHGPERGKPHGLAEPDGRGGGEERLHPAGRGHIRLAGAPACRPHRKAWPLAACTLARPGKLSALLRPRRQLCRPPILRPGRHRATGRLPTQPRQRAPIV